MRISYKTKLKVDDNIFKMNEMEPHMFPTLLIVHKWLYLMMESSTEDEV